MPHAIQNLFRPLYQATHWPHGPTYQHQQRQWMLDRVLNALPAQGMRTVVEVGCGDGWVCGELAKRFETVVGFDINPQRIGDQPTTANVLLTAASAAAPPIADGVVDLLVSVTVLEHLPDRLDALRRMNRMLKPNGKMVHLVPVSWWKLLQWGGFVPNLARKQARGITRALAGQRTPRQKKYYPGRETNNPLRPARRRWYQKLVPRVHGEYDSNLQEFLSWTPRAWAQQFHAAGLKVIQTVPLGMSSPYGFGAAWFTHQTAKVGLGSIVAYILEQAK